MEKIASKAILLAKFSEELPHMETVRCELEEVAKQCLLPCQQTARILSYVASLFLATNHFSRFLALQYGNDDWNDLSNRLVAIEIELAEDFGVRF